MKKKICDLPHITVSSDNPSTKGGEKFLCIVVSSLSSLLANTKSYFFSPFDVSAF